MLSDRKSKLAIGLIVEASLLLAACQPTVVEIPVTVFVPGTPEVQIVEVTSTPEPKEKVMTVCMAQEPKSLMWTADSLVSSAVLEAVYGGAIDARAYEYQPVLYEKLPSFQGGDASLDEVTVKEGEMVVDAVSHQPVPLTPGVNLHQLDGSTLVYAGSGSATAIQLSAQWTLIPGVTWSDGTPVTSDDQLYAYELDKSPDIPTSKDLVERTASFEALDERTTRWTGLPGYADSTYFLNVWAPQPRHAYGHLPPDQMLADETVNRKPLGYGPFRVVEWLEGDHITLEKNPTYYRVSDGLPHLDKLIFRFVPDINQLLAQLASGRCDLGTQDTVSEGSLPLVRQFAAEGLVILQVVGSAVFEHLDFNGLPADTYAGFAGTAENADGSPIFSNPEIRQAIADCIDRQVVVDQAAKGAGVVQHVYAPANHPLYPGEESLTFYPFDPAKGMELLAKNGWADTDGNGLLDNGKGQEFSFVYSTSNGPLRQRVAQVIGAQLKENCQIQASIELYGVESFSPGPRGLFFGRQFDVGEFAWRTGLEPPCNLYTTSQIPNEANGWVLNNDTGFSNTEFDEACYGALAAVDQAAKAGLHAQAMKIFTDSLPSLPLFAPAKVLVTRPNVTGVILDPTAKSELWNAENFDIAE